MTEVGPTAYGEAGGCDDTAEAPPVLEVGLAGKEIGRVGLVGSEVSTTEEFGGNFAASF